MEDEINYRLVFWAGTTLMTTAVIGIFLILISYHRFRSLQQQKEAERLLANSIESEKKERHRIARDLHDDIGGDLNAIANYLTTIKKMATEARIQELAKETYEYLSNTQASVQMISYNLMPPQLKVSGFIPAIKDYLERIEKVNEMQIKVIYNKPRIPIDPLYKYELFRIIQELTNNMLKHGKVSVITVDISVATKSTLIAIVDNGIPFNFSENYQTGAGMGLKNIMSRIRYIRATFQHKQSEKGNTTLIDILHTKDDPNSHS
ncbi:MAG: hypothetical protein EOP54_00565 [Sphingobacteriales bacterium]|nr:MAG: hypothetical protein EOP54_00565 [Sphingobacteriales bacterium]